MCLVFKEERQAKPGAVKALDYALLGAAGRPACERLVEAGGLASLFSAFMGKMSGKGKKAAVQTHTEMEHILSLISSLWTSLESDSPPRLRLLTKFVEKEYEKVDRLVELRAELMGRMEKAEQEAEEEDEDEDDKYLRKLEGGLGGLQQVDYIIAWICMEDDGVSTRITLSTFSQHDQLLTRFRCRLQVKDHVAMLLSRVSSSLLEVVAVLKEYLAHVGDDDLLNEPQPTDPSKEAGEEEADSALRQQEAQEKREILGALVAYLTSVA